MSREQEEMHSKNVKWPLQRHRDARLWPVREKSTLTRLKATPCHNEAIELNLRGEKGWSEIIIFFINPLVQGLITAIGVAGSRKQLWFPIQYSLQGTIFSLSCKGRKEWQNPSSILVLLNLRRSWNDSWWQPNEATLPSFQTSVPQNPLNTECVRAAKITFLGPTSPHPHITIL